MIKNKTHLDVVVGDKIITLQCDPDTQLTAVNLALEQFKNFVDQRIKEAIDSANQVQEDTLKEI